MCAPAPVVYQLRIVLRGVSLLIWRGVLIRGDTTVADLHATFQLVRGWTDEHLHHFVIHRRAYGVARLGGRLLELLDPLPAADSQDDEFVDRRAEELAEVLRWLRLDRFDRRVVNRRLGQQVATTESTRWR